MNPEDVKHYFSLNCDPGKVTVAVDFQDLETGFFAINMELYCRSHQTNSGKWVDATLGLIDFLFARSLHRCVDGFLKCTTCIIGPMHGM